MKKTTLEYATLCPDGRVIVQVMKTMVGPDTGITAFGEPHRNVILPLVTVGKALSQVNANFTNDLRYPTISDPDMKTVIAQSKAWHRVPAVAANINKAKRAAADYAKALN